MINIVCNYCKENSDPTQEGQGYLEINLNEKVIFFKCPFCKKSDKIKLYREDKKLPNIRGM